MSAGRYIMRGRVFQGRAFAPWALANAPSSGVDVDWYTVEMQLAGTSLQCMRLRGTSLQRLQLDGTSLQIKTLSGTQP